MRFRLSIALLLAVLLASSAGVAATDPCLRTACLVAYAHNRIAVDVDGNFNDSDDWAATPMTLALIAQLKLQKLLVHYSYNNSLGKSVNDPEMAAEMTQSTLGGARKFHFNKKIFFDCQTDLTDAIANLRSEIDVSSATDPLFIIAGGPMEVLWRAISLSDPAKRRYVTVISHSPWNDERVSPPEMTHTAADVRALGVGWIEIADQNARLDTGTDFGPWTWLRDSRDARLRWVYGRLRVSGKPDVSDAGMAYFLLHNDAYATPDKLQQALGDRVVAPAGSDLPVLQP